MSSTFKAFVLIHLSSLICTPFNYCILWTPHNTCRFLLSSSGNFQRCTFKCHVGYCEHYQAQFHFLPPASEGWREVIFSLCVSVHTQGGAYLPGGYLLRSGWGVPTFPGLGGGYLPSRWGGYLLSGLDGGVPTQVWMGGTYLGRGRGYLPR